MTASPRYFRPDILSGISVRVEQCGGRFGAKLAASLTELGARVLLEGRDPVGIEDQRAALAANWSDSPESAGRFDMAPSSPDALIRLFSKVAILPSGTAPSVPETCLEAAIKVGTVADMARRLGSAEVGAKVEIWIVRDAGGEQCETVERLLAGAWPRRVYAIGRARPRTGWIAALSENDLPTVASVASLAAQLLAPAGHGVANQCFLLPDEDQAFVPLP